MSSASRHDLHTSISAGYERSFKNNQWTTGGEFLLSIESDYLSRGAALWLLYQRSDQTQSLGVDFRAFFDDLRWGRLQPAFLIEARELVYPQELRGKEWFNIYHRHSYNLSIDYRHDLNKRMSLSLYPTYVYQQGLLSTPFHRVYFNGIALPRVENLPHQRHQGAIGLQLNAFIRPRLILRNFYQYYRA
ncbi:MAG: hypothetical protein U5L96_21105 [Owenweeksia sp.]|nr:hypothetical protein [Owenweeksia sp.]